MAFSKAHLYPTDLQAASANMKALAYPGRIEILLYLQRHGPSCVQEIAQAHPISGEAISTHLRILSKADLISWQERYPYTFYQVNQQRLQETIDLLKQLMSRLE
jgi:ArsR family transcriptional regulator